MARRKTSKRTKATKRARRQRDQSETPSAASVAAYTTAEIQHIDSRLAELEAEKRELEAARQQLGGMLAYVHGRPEGRSAVVCAAPSPEAEPDLPPELVRALQDKALSQVRKAIAVVYYLGRPMSFTDLYAVLSRFGVAAHTAKPKDRIRGGIWGEQGRNGRFGKHEDSGNYDFLSAEGRRWFRDVLVKAGYNPDPSSEGGS